MKFTYPLTHCKGTCQSAATVYVLQIPFCRTYKLTGRGRTKLTLFTAGDFHTPLGPLNQNGNQLLTDPNSLHAAQLQRRAGKTEKE